MYLQLHSYVIQFSLLGKNFENAYPNWVYLENVGASQELLSSEHLSSIFQQGRNPYQFAVHIARVLFSPTELRDSNCRGVKDRNPLDKRRLKFIKAAVMKFYNVPPENVTAVWKQCVQSIDTRCRHERRLTYT